MPVGEERAEHMERDILSVFREQLGDTDMEPVDDYFERGGDSLSALLVVGELIDTVGVNVGVDDLFGHPSARGLARYLALEAADTPDSPPSLEDRTEPECDARLMADVHRPGHRVRPRR